MRHPLALGLAVLALTAPLTAEAQAGPPALRAEITKLSQAWQAAYNAADAAALTAFYSLDATVLPPGAEPVTGAAAIKAFFAADVASGATNTLTTTDVVGSGDVAVETGKWVAQAKDGKHLDHGSYVTVYRKVSGGWKIYRDTWNSSMKQ
jgi:uncharacterized protein (TIGR02246 family)